MSQTMISRGSRRLATALKPAMSQTELASRLGVTRQAVNGWATGLFKPTPEMMARIEDLLGIPMRDWTEEENGKDAA